MKIQTTITFDTLSGDYDIKFNNLSNPGESMELSDIQEMLSLIVKDFYIQINGTPLPEGFFESTN